MGQTLTGAHCSSSRIPCFCLPFASRQHDTRRESRDYNGFKPNQNDLLCMYCPTAATVLPKRASRHRRVAKTSRSIALLHLVENIVYPQLTSLHVLGNVQLQIRGEFVQHCAEGQSDRSHGILICFPVLNNVKEPALVHGCVPCGKVFFEDRSGVLFIQ